MVFRVTNNWTFVIQRPRQAPDGYGSPGYCYCAHTTHTSSRCHRCIPNALGQTQTDLLIQLCIIPQSSIRSSVHRYLTVASTVQPDQVSRYRHLLPDLRERILFRVSIFGYKAYFARQQGRGHDRFRRHGFRDAPQKGSRFQNHRFRDAKRKFPRIFERFVADAARARAKQVRIECPLCASSGRLRKRSLLKCSDVSLI